MPDPNEPKSDLEGQFHDRQVRADEFDELFSPRPLTGRQLFVRGAVVAALLGGGAYTCNSLYTDEVAKPSVAAQTPEKPKNTLEVRCNLATADLTHGFRVDCYGYASRIKFTSMSVSTGYFGKIEIDVPRDGGVDIYTTAAPMKFEVGKTRSLGVLTFIKK